MDKNQRKALEQKLDDQARRMRKAQEEKSTLLSQLSQLGSLGFLFVIPVVVGAYLGSWLDSKVETFQTSWTVSLIIIGVFIGALNVYLFVRDND